LPEPDAIDFDVVTLESHVEELPARSDLVHEAILPSKWPSRRHPDCRVSEGPLRAAGPYRLSFRGRNLADTDPGGLMVIVESAV
jgi:hypothetical protein